MPEGLSRRALLGAALMLCGCGSNHPTTVKAHAGFPVDTVPPRRDAEDVARFIAGMPSEHGSPYAVLEGTEAWQAHRKLLDDAWSHAETNIVQPLQAFQSQELTNARLESAPVFYPFGGPDALTPTTFFPNAPAYVMVGLEPAGTLPSVAEIEQRLSPAYLGALRETVSSVLQRSFFITAQMDHQLRGQVNDGLLVPILHLLVRRGNNILGFRYVRLDEKGEVIDRPADYKAPGRFGNKGVEIEFRAPGKNRTQKLFYFSVNLADDRLTENTPFLAFLGQLKGATTLLKATSYMPHQRGFSLIRNRILEISGAVLQDDSGVPYRFFSKNDWKTQPYGEYTRPYGSFAWMQQPDLREAFAHAKPLHLRLSYGFSKAPSNLLLAMRTK